MVFSHDEIPEGRTLPLSPIGAFLPCKKWKRQSKFTLPFFSVFQRKWLASVYERHNESSTFDPLKNRFLASDFMKILTIVCFCFWRHERSECHFAFAFAFWGLGLAPSKPRVGILNGSEKVPSVYPCSMLFKIFGFSPSFAKNCPWRNEVKSKKLSFSENRGQFSWKKWAFNVFKCF